ncbi:MAG TPA: hypothetical protein VMY42_15565 [Thermoguttaceae bacterium]|nr:hypothetical protein [Thermoguttaceae bacterium]
MQRTTTSATWKPAIVATLAILITSALPSRATAVSRQLADALAGPMAGVEEIVFAVRATGGDGHWYANFGYWASDENRMMYGPDGGRLCRLDLRTGEVRTVLDDPGGGVRDPQVHYDGNKILFSYRRAGSKYYHLHEINADGSGLRQLTDGPYDDLEPIYLPDGEIMFCSSRCKRWVQCWHTHVAILYRCDADGQNVRAVSSNVEQDNTPWMLPDGRVLYMRWEYVDRSRVRYHHLWTSNPDGTASMVYYGNMHPGTVMLDAKPIPGGQSVVSIFSPGHGRKEHAGAVTVVDPKAGPDARGHARPIGTGSNYRDPYPFSEDCFLVAENAELLLLDGAGNTEVIYTLPAEDRNRGFWCHEPRPLRPRSRQRVIPSRIDPAQSTGRLILADVTHGRNMAGVQPAEIKKLLVMETLPKPINHSGTMEPTSLGGTFTLPRILGTVPVEPDGSAYLEVPALRSLFFIALDENDMSVKRMQSFVNVMPGETTSCVGCHENRTDTSRSRVSPTLLALQRRPSKIEPVEDVPDVLDFPRDVQPILDAHCVECHGYARRDGGVVLTGDRGPIYSHAYATLMTRGLVSHGLDADGNRPPRTIGTSATRLMQYLDGSHYDVELPDPQHKMVRLWIESGAPYAGTYAALGSGMVGVRLPNDVLQRRCGGCHAKGPPGHEELRCNLTCPEKSLVLLAPLSKDAGGFGLCTNSPGNGQSAEVFKSMSDPDFQDMLDAIEGAKRQLEAAGRFDMPDFRPRRDYVREMIRFGILPEAFDPATDPIDVYATDREYWKSLWHQPTR